MTGPHRDEAPRRRPVPDRIVGIGLVAIGLLAGAGSLAIARDYDGSAAARIFPMATAAAILVLGVMAVRAGPDGAAMPESPVEPRDGRGPVAILGLAFGYLWLMTKVGYLLSTALAAPAALWIFGIRSRAALVASAILCPLVFHLIFFALLGTFPPVGAWFDPRLMSGY